MKNTFCFGGDFGPFVNAPAGHPDNVTGRGYDGNEAPQGAWYLVINHESVEAFLVTTQAQGLETIAWLSLPQH